MNLHPPALRSLLKVDTISAFTDMRQFWFDIGSVWGGGSSAQRPPCHARQRIVEISSVVAAVGPITPSHHKYSRKITSWVDMILAFSGRYPGQAPNVFLVRFNIMWLHSTANTVTENQELIKRKYSWQERYITWKTKQNDIYSYLSARESKF